MFSVGQHRAEHICKAPMKGQGVSNMLTLIFLPITDFSCLKGVLVNDHSSFLAQILIACFFMQSISGFDELRKEQGKP